MHAKGAAADQVIRHGPKLSQTPYGQASFGAMRCPAGLDAGLEGER